MMRAQLKNLWILLILCLFPGILHATSVIQISGKEIPEWLDQDISKFRIYAGERSGPLRVIPFQVDEKTGKKGKKPRSWAMDFSPAKKSGALQGNGKFDSDEVILFLEKDAGVLIPAERFSQALKILEIAVGRHGSKKVYLVLEENPTKISFSPYIRYHPEKDQVETSYYQVSFSKRRPLIQDQLIIKNGSSNLDILDRFKARFKLAVKNFFDFKFDEEKIKSKLLGFRVGPIRVLRRVQAWKNLGPIRLIPKSKIDFLFYPDWIEVPTRIKNPVDGPKVLEEKTKGLSGFDFNQNVLGSRFFTNLSEAPIPLDGRGEGNTDQLSGPYLQWWSFSGPGGSMVVGLHNDTKLRDLDIHPSLVLIEELNRGNPPESEKGEIFIGFKLPYHRIPKGDYSILVKQVYPKHFQHSRETAYLNQARVRSPFWMRPLK